MTGRGSRFALLESEEQDIEEYVPETQNLGVQGQAACSARKEKVVAQDNKKFKTSLQKTAKISNRDARQNRAIESKLVDEPIKIVTSESTQFRKQTVTSRLPSKDVNNEGQLTELRKVYVANSTELIEQEAFPIDDMSNGGHHNMIGVGFNGDARERSSNQGNGTRPLPGDPGSETENMKIDENLDEMRT
ncbi:uncharacterized protein LOC110417228 [Herrania umbratica]|uniref:Uncharacterized protein LOC110417228 n=1 Tax=Herrania umbratica TaxID=108875 RepID=A0A6J1AD74_9ROSI|nr:uncharacterized protein LOC110417228 [Herrania umbratica]